MNLSLVDELSQRQVNKFQINNIHDVIRVGSPNFIGKIIKENTEGILNLSSKIDEKSITFLVNYLAERYNGNPFDKYEFELKYNPSVNSEIMFKKKELKN